MSTTKSNWTSDHPRFVMDLNGDGRADMLGIGPDCVWTCLNRGPTGFGEPTFQLVAFEANSGWRTGDHPRFLADLTGDGRADLAWFRRRRRLDGASATGTAVSGRLQFVLGGARLQQGLERRVSALPRGSDRRRPRRHRRASAGMGSGWRSATATAASSRRRSCLADFAFNTGWRVDKHPRFVADLTGDGRADILGFGDDGVWVALGNGDGSFQPARFVLAELGFNQGWRVENHPRFVADLTGDGRADIIGFGDDGVWVALGNGDGSFQPARFVSQRVRLQHGLARRQASALRRGPHRRRPRRHRRFRRRRHLGRARQWRRQLPARRIRPRGSGLQPGWRVEDHPRFLADIDGDGSWTSSASVMTDSGSREATGDGTFGGASSSSPISAGARTTTRSSAGRSSATTATEGASSMCSC